MTAHSFTFISIGLGRHYLEEGIVVCDYGWFDAAFEDGQEGWAHSAAVVAAAKYKKHVQGWVAAQACSDGDSVHVLNESGVCTDCGLRFP